MEDKSKYILYINGGVMAGIFGAGVVTALEESGIYDKWKAIYGSSAGALTAAYFLSGQAKLGSSIFYDDLVHDFITPRYVPLGTWDRFRSRYFKKLPVERMRNPIDINYLFEVVSGSKKLDSESLIKRNVEFYAHVLNTENMKSEFVDICRSENPLEDLKSAVSAVPYYFPKRGLFIDGDIINPFPIGDIIKLHPGHRVVAVINIMPRKLIRRFLKAILEGFVASSMYGVKIWKVYLLRDYRAKRELRNILHNKDILIVSPDNSLKLWPNTLNRKKLLRAYQEGIDSGRKLAASL